MWFSEEAQKVVALHTGRHVNSSVSFLWVAPAVVSLGSIGLQKRDLESPGIWFSINSNLLAETQKKKISSSAF